MKQLTAWREHPAARAYLLALSSGVLIALSFPSPGISPLAWVALVPLLVAVEGRGAEESFRLGFCAGVSAYAAIFYWLNIVMIGHGKLHWSVSGTVYLVAVAYLALYPAAVLLLMRRGEERGLAAVWSFPVLWVAGEVIRNYLPVLGFSWASLGYSQYRTLPLIQISDLTGVYGVSFLVAFGNVVFYRMWVWARGTGVRYPFRSFAVLLLLIVATVGYGFDRLNTPERGAVQRVLLVQGNIPQGVKWNPAYQESTLATYERLSRKGCQNPGTLVVWPETALPFYLERDKGYAARATALAAELKSPIVTGSPTKQVDRGAVRYFNSAYLVSPAGIAGRSDKLHLVAFGEYVPFARLLPFVSKLVAGNDDYSPGRNVVTLETPPGKIGALICFEAIFPELARAYVQKGAGLLVNLTNDAWFGNSSAPYQHMSMTVFRAVENRVPLVRCANTGISAVIDSKGHVRGMTDLFEEATLAAEVRRGTGGSFYSRFGDLFALTCLGGAGLVAAARAKRSPPPEGEG